MGKACDLANVQRTSLVREVLREQVGSVGASIDARASVMLSAGATLVSQLSDLFKAYIDAALDNHTSTYCPIYEGFISIDVRGKRGQRQQFVQSRFSVRELSDLMGLIGPTGVRFVQANLLEKVFKPAATSMVEIVHHNREKIPALEKAVDANSPTVLDIAGSMGQLDEFMVQLGRVSVLLAFRHMLYAALAHAGGKTPIIQQFCRLATRGVGFEVSSESMDLVSQACGIDPVADYLMQDALAAVRAGVLKSVGGDGGAPLDTLGNSFAVLAAAAYTAAGFWDPRVRLETQLGVFNNNAHLFGPALAKLVYDLTTLEASAVGRGPGSGSGSGAGLAGNKGAKQTAAEAMKRHFRASADILLRQKQSPEGRNQCRMPLQAMAVALQMAVDSSRTLVGNANFFENIMPYKFVHFCWADVVRGRLGNDPRTFPPKAPAELLYFV